jgi:hypothetical protein
MTKDNWMKSELSIRAGFKELAIEVCMQWVRDGKPEYDKESVERWWKLANLSNDYSDIDNVTCERFKNG